MLVTYLLWIHLLCRVTHTQLLEITSSNLPPKYVKSMKLEGLFHSWFYLEDTELIKNRQETRRKKKEREEEGREAGVRINSNQI